MPFRPFQQHLNHALGFTTLCLGLSFAAFPAQAQTCRALPVVGGEHTEVTKIISPLGTLFTRDNWNTDFVVPGNTSYRSFSVTLDLEIDEVYDVNVYYKYSDGTSDQVYSMAGVIRTTDTPLVISNPDRTNNNPYQINVHVGGFESEGNQYTVSVRGCR